MSDAFDERSAILEHDGKLPRDWAEALARLDTASTPPAYAADQWRRLVADAFALIGAWLHRIEANDWAPDDVRGLIPLIQGREVIAVGRGDVTVQAPGFAPEKIYHRPATNGPARWDIGRRAA